MFNPDKYLSVAWLKGGRVYLQLDCFGIVNEIRADLGLTLWPEFAGVTQGAEHHGCPLYSRGQTLQVASNTRFQ